MKIPILTRGQGFIIRSLAPYLFPLKSTLVKPGLSTPSIFILILATCLSYPSSAEAPATEKHWTLNELIANAQRHNAEIERWHWKVAAADARRRQARAARILPHLRIESESGLVPEAIGDIYQIADTSNFRPLGPFNRTQLEFGQPLYPLGRIRSLNEAATKGVDVERADLTQARLEIAFEIKEFYYGLLLAQDLNDLVQRLSSELNERKDQLADEDGLSLSKHYKLELALLELAKQEREINTKIDLAGAALAWRAGLPPEAPLLIEDKWLAPIATEIPPLDELSAKAISHRPDWRKLQAGLAAKEALLDAARAAYQPQIYLGGGIRYAIAPGRTDQRNPFVKDNFNYFNGGVFLGIRQSLEWHLLSADVDKAKAEYRELKARENGAVQGIRLDIRRAYMDYRRTDQALAGARQSRQLARQWLQEAGDEYDFDPATIGDLISAFETWAQLEQNYSQAIYDFNLSVANLEKITGGLELSLND